MALAPAVLPAPAPIGALTVGVTDAGLALVAFGADLDAAQRAASRLGEPLLADPVLLVSRPPPRPARSSVSTWPVSGGASTCRWTGG